jgi:outer membrane protein
MKIFKLFYLTGIYAFLLPLLTAAQGTVSYGTAPSGDSLELPRVLQTILGSHPAILRAMEGIQAAEGGIGLSKSTWYPVIGAEASYTRIGPVPDITIENFGSFQMAPANVINGDVYINQIIYDFAKTARNVRLALSSKEISEKNVDLIKQKLTLLASVNYFTLVYVQEAIRIKDVQIDNLNRHLEYVTKRKETGSATQYEILTTRVRISTAQNQKSDLERSRISLLGLLNTLMGQPVDAPLLVKSTYTLLSPSVPGDSLIPYALQHRNEMQLAHLFEKHAELNLGVVKIQNNPVLAAYGTGGFKNGYFPDLEIPQANFAVGVGIRVPIFDATRHKFNMQIASSQVNASKQETESTRRDISAEVNENEAAYSVAKEKIIQSELQVQQAEEARKLAQVNFSIGAITNLDLLDAETSAADSRLTLLKARVDLAISIARLDISLGRPVQ